MKIVSDTSPLIVLCKINRLKLLERNLILIPIQVFNEIKRGKEKGNIEISAIEGLIANKKIIVKEIKPFDQLPFTIAEGENAAISLALKENADILLIDDNKGRKMARYKGLNVKGTLGILIDAFNKKEITIQELKEDFKKLISVGFYIQEEELMKLLSDLEQKNATPKPKRN